MGVDPHIFDYTFKLLVVFFKTYINQMYTSQMNDRKLSSELLSSRGRMSF